MTARPNRAIRWLFRLPVCLYHWRLGWLLGHRFLLLIHTGRRSGRRHETVLEVMEYRAASREAVVMNAFGRNSDWRRNIEARPGAEIIIGREQFLATHRDVEPEEAAAVVAGYERRNRLMAPIVRLGLRWLAGWPYRGTDADRQRLVAQLPLIAFRPAA
ncbi:MAG TPA: nitroreductase family deazaflavin-dependent oxidoreductase [Stellaceae bacterium]|nr:nitroreductase family deazaflavin-dependent oxidoreductase [Stellaceae bacterium]